jgi:hypothetical protein
MTMREESRLRVFVNSRLMKEFAPKGDEVMFRRESSITKVSMICTPYPIMCGVKWTIIGWTEQVTRMGTIEVCT